MRSIRTEKTLRALGRLGALATISVLTFAAFAMVIAYCPLEAWADNAAEIPPSSSIATAQIVAPESTEGDNPGETSVKAAGSEPGVQGEVAPKTEGAENPEASVETRQNANGTEEPVVSDKSADNTSEPKKVAIPAISKTVSAGGAWAQDVDAQSGAKLFYRIAATMPEDVEHWDKLIYRIIDNPAPGVTIDWKTLGAHIESSTGAAKASVKATVSSSGTNTVIYLGNLKEADPSIAFGDTVVVEYAATLPTTSKSEAYRNVARLEYQVDGSWVSTVDVDTTARTKSPPESGSTFAKTGYYLMRYWWVALVIGTALVIAGAILRKRHV